MNDLDDQAVGALASARCVAVLTGAGVSAESGIPTFRGSRGLWRGMDPLSLATPDAFAADSKLVWEFYAWRRAIVAGAEPNPAHHALVALADLVPRLTLITQNVDRLHQRAGSRDVIELHGNLHEVRCSGCHRTEDRGLDPLPLLPTCESCGSLLRPGVVWFGESLPSDALLAAEAAVAESDVVLVVGTSAVVYPAAGLIPRDRHSGRTVIEVNLEPTPASESVAISLQGPAGSILTALVARVRDLQG